MQNGNNILKFYYSERMKYDCHENKLTNRKLRINKNGIQMKLSRPFTILSEHPVRLKTGFHSDNFMTTL